MGALVNGLTDKEKSAISKEREKFLKNHSKLSKKFLLYSKEEQKWVLNYLLTEKGTIPCEMITTEYHSLDIVPDKGEFFLPHNSFQP